MNSQPSTPASAPTPASAKEDAQAVSGTYIFSLRSETSFLKAAGVIGEVTVSAAEDGTIEVSALTDPTGKPKRWREVAPMTFREVNGQEVLIFKPDRNGNLEMLRPFPFSTFQRVGLWENKRLLLPVVGISLLTRSTLSFSARGGL